MQKRKTPKLAKHAERIVISNDLLAKARDKSLEIGELKGSFTKGRGQLYGLVGQELVKQRIGGTGGDTYDYDFLLPNGLRVEVKTKKVGSLPLGHYWCSVPDTSLHQRTDIYVFTRVRDDFSEGWIIGWMTRDEFLLQARHFNKGDKDPLGGKWPFPVACLNVIADSLKPIASLLTFKPENPNIELQQKDL